MISPVKHHLPFNSHCLLADHCLHVQVAGARKVHVAHIQDGGQPATSPGPGHNHRVDEGRHEEGEDGVGGRLHTFRHGTADDGGAGSAEGPLEEPGQPGTEIGNNSFASCDKKTVSIATLFAKHFLTTPKATQAHGTLASIGRTAGWCDDTGGLVLGVEVKASKS